MIETQIFDTYNVDDLPKELQEVIKTDSFESRIIELFKIANRPLHINEITAAYWRKYGEVKTKKQITVRLYNMIRLCNPKIVKHRGKGYYKLAEKDLEK